jgi:hypothetical protein
MGQCDSSLLFKHKGLRRLGVQTGAGGFPDICERLLSAISGHHISSGKPVPHAEVESFAEVPIAPSLFASDGLDVL